MADPTITDLRRETALTAAVLRKAADRLDADMERFFTEWPDEPRNSPYALGRKDAATELRSWADVCLEHGVGWLGLTPPTAEILRVTPQPPHPDTAAVARVRTLAEDMRDWCSPHGLAADYAGRILEALDGPGPTQT